ncbi:hypothetical protein WR25_01818 [Diploscapter pachys]|uniref:Uncharacterized protein n=1 Tax=Diploscapter pachys TaxID=2018661 RepID=A0A2A2K4K2_9BILA|nr:hypothetical protein WR25_01818 [Diploscapter pachys]
MQQGLERGQQEHEQGHVMLPGERLELGNQAWLEVHRQARALILLHHRARAIGGQLEDRLCAAQARLPVVELTLLLTGFHPLALPGRVVGVLEGQRRQLRGLTVQMAFIAAHQFVDQDRHRPAVGNDMVQDQYQHMLVGGQAQQAGAQQRAVFQVERLAYLLLDPGLHAGFVQNGRGNVQRRFQPRMHHLLGTVALLAEGSAQGFVTGDQRGEAAAQCLDIQLALQAQGRRDVVGSAGRFQLPEEPLALLGVGQGQRLVAVNDAERRCLAGRTLAGGLGEGLQVGGFEQAAQRDFHIQALADPRGHLGGQQRVAADTSAQIAASCCSSAVRGAT